MVALNLDFEQSYSTFRLRLRDTSNYYNTVISNVTLEIRPPAFKKVNVEFVPNQINEYQTSDLLIGCEDDTPLPDGIYEIKYSIFPNSTNWIKKKFMFTNNIVASMQTMYLNLQMECPCGNEGYAEAKSKLDQVKILIEGAISATNECEEDLAMDFLTKAQNLIARINSDCDC